MTPRSTAPSAHATPTAHTAEQLAGTWLRTVLEHGDPARTRRGLALARSGAVQEVHPHWAEQHVDVVIEARVQGSAPAPYDVTLAFAPLDEEEWPLLRRSIRPRLAAGAFHANPAALVEALNELSEAQGSPLLPGPADTETWCTCPDDADPCKHAVAVVHALASMIESDPLVVLLLRGHDPASARSWARAAHRVVSPRAAPTAQPPDELRGHTPATVAFARPAGQLPALPGPFPQHAVLQPALRAADPSVAHQAPAPDVDTLLLLSTDAALRARMLLNRLLARAHDGPVPTDESVGLAVMADAVRWAATHPLSPAQRLAVRRILRCRAGELENFVTAWRFAGIDGLKTLMSRWDPPPDIMRAAEQQVLVQLRAAHDRPRLQRDANRLLGHDPALHLRYGPDDQWHPYHPNGARPAGPPHADAVAAMHYLLAPNPAQSGAPETRGRPPGSPWR
ncbi:SWIM zinc finger family protein [Streptomyces sp. NPDC053474]|uniref:SWIM zinc finger family protein n=1 Tax=Streptomyces sp. NPDC053474 TaxID=3365704 RepID=UPI0037D040B6